VNNGLDSLGQVKGTLLDLAIRFGPKVLTATLIIAVGVFIAGWTARTTARGLRRFDLEPPVRQLLTRLARILVLALFLIMALQNLGVELLPLLAGLGVAGAGIALATQGVLSNVVAGLTIIFTKPYRVGEYIAVVGVEGTVETITLFSTTLRHADRSRIVVPNRKVVGEILQNFGRIRQCDIRVGLAYGSDLAAALGALREVVQSNSRVLADRIRRDRSGQTLGRGPGLRGRRGRGQSGAGRGASRARHHHSLPAARGQAAQGRRIGRRISRLAESGRGPSGPQPFHVRNAPVSRCTKSDLR
jgi:small conductance mechanosensitive channel